MQVFRCKVLQSLLHFAFFFLAAKYRVNGSDSEGYEIQPAQVKVLRCDQVLIRHCALKDADIVRLSRGQPIFTPLS